MSKIFKIIMGILCCIGFGFFFVAFSVILFENQSTPESTTIKQTIPANGSQWHKETWDDHTWVVRTSKNAYGSLDSISHDPKCPCYSKSIKE